MPSTNEHLSKAEHNAWFVNYLGLACGLFRDWRVTGQFYSALHLVDAYLAINGCHPPGHHLRGTYIERDPALSSIYADYQELSNLSREARYTNQPLSIQDLKDSSHSLRVVRQHIRQVLPL